MRELTIYVANDGSRHDTPAEAESRDAKLAAIADAMWGLGERPTNNPAFIGGLAFLQHNLSAVARSKTALLKLYASTLPPGDPNLAWLTEIDPGVVDFTSGGLLSSYARGTWLGEAWSRLGRIDDRGREWSSVYFSVHPMPGAVAIGTTERRSPAEELTRG